MAIIQSVPLDFSLPHLSSFLQCLGYFLISRLSYWPIDEIITAIKNINPIEKNVDEIKSGPWKSFSFLPRYNTSINRSLRMNYEKLKRNILLLDNENINETNQVISEKCVGFFKSSWRGFNNGFKHSWKWYGKWSCERKTVRPNSFYFTKQV